MRLATLALLFVAATAQAIPRFSLRTGAPCSMCHVDPTGAGMRTDYARSVYEVARLPLASLTLPRGASPLDARLSDSVALGSDVRTLFQYARRPDADQPKIGSFYLMEAALYLSADLWQRLTLYMAPMLYGSETFAFEASAITRLPWAGLYIKAGRFIPPFGWKVANHSAFTRKGLGFNVRDKQVGIEIGLNPGPFELQVAVVNGISEKADSDWDENLLKAVSARAAWLMRTRWVNLELGASAYYNVAGNPAEDDPSGADTRLEDLKVGGFAGLSVGRFTWLGEADYWRRDDRAAEFPVGQMATYQELGCLLMQGLDLVLTYELHDPDVQVQGDALHRFGGGFELYAWPFLEIDAFYRYSLADRRVESANVHEAMAVVHAFF